MTELLVVLLILAILLALVAGISRYVIQRAAVEDTISRQKIVLDAIARYYDLKKAYPTGDMTAVMTALDDVPQCKSIIGDLQKEAWGGRGTPLKDGFDENMTYSVADGFGGVPVIISKGADRQTPTEDDIRSDRQ